MGTRVMLRLKDGRSLQRGRASDPVAVDRDKADVQGWLDASVALSVANAKGQLEELTPRSVISVETVTDSAADGPAPRADDSAAG